MALTRAGLVLQIAPSIESYIGKVFDSIQGDEDTPLRVTKVRTAVDVKALQNLTFSICY